MLTDPFARTLKRWEAKRDIAALRDDADAIHEKARALLDPIFAEIRRIEEEAWPLDFYKAMRDARMAHEYYLLQHAGIAAFEDVQGATDGELLAIRGIGPARVKRIRDLVAQHAH